VLIFLTINFDKVCVELHCCIAFHFLSCIVLLYSALLFA